MEKKLNQNFIFILRFIAILFVMIHHSIIYVGQYNNKIYEIIPIGTYGVYLFFFISGYCLSYSFFTRNENGFKSFYIRRFFRIVPLYFFFGILFYFFFRIAKYYFINDILFIDNSTYNFKNIISNLLFIHGFVISANNNVVPGGWSIANEMFYYVLFPLIVFTFYKNKRFGSFYKQLILFFGLILILQTLNIIFQENDYLIFIFENTINPVLFFIFGVILFDFNSELRINLKKVNFYSSILLFILLLVNFLFKNIFIEYLILIIIFLLIFLFLEQFQFKKNIFLIFKNYGKASYGAYLTHFFIIEMIGYFLIKRYLIEIFSVPIILFVMLFITFILTYFVSRLINISIEKRFIDYGNKLILKKKN